MSGTVILKYTLIEAYNRRLLLLYLLGVIISLAMAAYAAGLALTDKPATMAAFYGFTVRMVTVAILGFYIILIEARILERDNALVWLGLPLSRLRYLLEKSLAYALITLVLVVVACLPLAWVGIKPGVIFAWGGSLYCELSMMAFLCLLLAILFRQPLTALASLSAIYLFARGSAEFYRHSTNILQDSSGLIESVIAFVVRTITYVVPKLELFAASAWLLHQEMAQPQWLPILLQTLVFCLLLLLLAFDRLQRRPF